MGYGNKVHGVMGAGWEVGWRGVGRGNKMTEE